MYCSKVKFGDVVELVVETFLLKGCDTLSKVTKKVADRLELDGDADKKTDVDFVVQKCKELIAGQFLMRVKNPKEQEENDEKHAEEKRDNDEEDGKQFVVPQGIKTHPHLWSLYIYLFFLGIYI